MRAVGYVRVSTEEQGLRGVSLDAQAAAVQREVQRRQWAPAEIVREVGSAGALENRPALVALLERLRAGEADVLVVARLDRLSRSTADFCVLLDRAAREGWQVLCLDPPVDMTSPFGRALAQMSAVFAELERALISQRTREAVAAAKANGTYRNRTSTIPEDVQRKIARLRRRGWTWVRIIDQLEQDGDVAPAGGQWSTRTLRRVCDRLAA